MKTGTCRHCGTGPVAVDAPECTKCGGRGPNPGILTRLNVKFGIMLGFLMLAATAIVLTFSPTMGLIYMLPTFGIGGSTLLFNSLVRPYG